MWSLPPKFNYVVATIEESKDLSNSSLVELMCSLQVHEQRLNRANETSLKHAFQLKLDWNRNSDILRKYKNSGCYGHGHGNSGRGKGWGGLNGQRNSNEGNFTLLACLFYGKANHTINITSKKSSLIMIKMVPNVIIVKNMAILQKTII